MSTFLAFVVVTVLYIAAPGPGVILTIGNALRTGFVASLPGIFGIAFGMLCVGALAAAGISLVLQTSATAFAILKYIGAAYLIYVGVRQWRSVPAALIDRHPISRRYWQRFIEGFGITLLNPKAAVFYLAFFPQFIDPAVSYAIQFVTLAGTFSALLVVIHCAYSGLASVASAKARTAVRSRLVSRASGVALMGFGAALAVADRAR